MKERASMNRTITLTDEDWENIKLNTNYVEGISDIYATDFYSINNQITNGYFDLIILDPPYNLTKKYGENVFKSMPNDEYVEYIKKIFIACLRVLKPNGTMYICGDWNSSYLHRRALDDISDLCDVINRITWSREKGRGSEKNWKNNIEDIYMVVKDKNNYKFNIDAVKMRKTVYAPYKDKNGNNKDWDTDDEGKYRMTCPSNVWFDITVPFWSMKENTDHPTQKSEKLYAKLILASSNPNDIVYEPFAGVGTACVTAKKLGRQFVGVEIEPEYCMLAKKRLMMADLDPTIQGYEDGVFRDR